MVDAILSTNLDIAKRLVDSANIYAGIIYDKDGNVVDKILFERNYNVGRNVFNTDEHVLFNPSEVCEDYVSDIVPLDTLIRDSLGRDKLNLIDLYRVYRMFLDNPNFINRHLVYFDMEEVEVGYKCKTEIRPINCRFETSGEKLYNSLMKVINCKELQQKKSRAL